MCIFSIFLFFFFHYIITIALSTFLFQMDRRDNRGQAGGPWNNPSSGGCGNFAQVGYGPNSQCQFPAPPPPRVYCQPAPFTSACGQRYQPLAMAYGQSRSAYWPY